MKPIDRLDNSMISDYQHCPRFFYHRHGEFLKSKIPNLGAEFGTALHHARDAFYNGKTESDIHKAFLDYFLQFEGLDQNGIRTCVKGIETIDQFIKFYENDFDLYDIIGVELSGAMDMGFFLYIGRMDLLVVEKASKRKIVDDLKTSGRRGYLTLNPNYQTTGYVAMVQEMGSPDCKTGRLDQVYYYKGNKPAVLVREEVEKTPQQIKEWYRDTQWQASMIHNSCRCDHFPRNTNSCSRYGRCPYIDLCSCSDGETIRSMKENMFTIEKWEPFPSSETPLMKQKG